VVADADARLVVLFCFTINFLEKVVVCVETSGPTNNLDDASVALSLDILTDLALRSLLYTSGRGEVEELGSVLNMPEAAGIVSPAAMIFMGDDGGLSVFSMLSRGLRGGVLSIDEASLSPAKISKWGKVK
jgi:hypothetical protein